jgi:hypothetical protein
MSALSVQPPFPIFTETDGQPLENGYIWIGTANLNPITNPINVYWDVALTQPAAQPIRTVSGYPSNAGTPARLYVNSDYSIQVQTKNGVVVYGAPTATERYSRAVVDIIFTPSNATGDGSQTIFAVAQPPLFIYIDGVYQNENTYSFSNGQITFSEAPPLNSIIEFLV